MQEAKGYLCRKTATPNYLRDYSDASVGECVFWQGLCGVWRYFHCSFYFVGGGGEIDGTVPDTYDLIGGLVALIGVAIIMYAPRG